MCAPTIEGPSFSDSDDVSDHDSDINIGELQMLPINESAVETSMVLDSTILDFSSIISVDTESDIDTTQQDDSNTEITSACTDILVPIAASTPTRSVHDLIRQPDNRRKLQGFKIVGDNIDKAIKPRYTMHIHT